MTEQMEINRTITKLNRKEEQDNDDQSEQQRSEQTMNIDYEDNQINKYQKRLSQINYELELINSDLDQDPFPQTDLSRARDVEREKKALQQSSNIDDQEDRLEIESNNNIVTVPLTCQISHNRINIPIRGLKCTHDQCVDLENYLSFIDSSREHVCPICGILITFSDIRVDICLELILQAVGQDKTQVEILNDGRFRAVKSEIEYKTGLRSDIGEEDDELQLLDWGRNLNLMDLFNKRLQNLGEIDQQNSENIKTKRQKRQMKKDGQQSDNNEQSINIDELESEESQ
ncbi:MAG: hypothetical protein EZS28_009282 [Streblomastix strix]|uniref:SP-RING-type domain-containing protein n=1 Tax=Streblomastix strix TaxID=222440 RepID=A0A5J4WK53_9EUKA|nr:MAG: hypothetical protein EZS28_009282 [Streblomastix strix]